VNKLADNVVGGRSSPQGGAAVRLALVCALSLLPLAGLAALDVAKSEIESTSGAKVTFVNYEGPQTVVQSAAEIRGIGAALAAAIGKPDGASARAGDLARYAVIRAVDPKTVEGLDADILIIGKDSIIDHIDNVRRVIAGYLEGAWGYSRADAATLAVFITVYNAVHRGDLTFFGAKYKSVVTKELSAADAGLSTKWDEWPGKTRILIPLSSGAQPGAAGAVSTGTISGKEVTQSMKSEPGAGIPERQALVDIKQKEVGQAQDQAAQAAAAASAAAAKAAADQAQLAQAQKDLAAAQKAAPASPAAPAPNAGTGTPQAQTAQPSIAQAPAGGSAAPAGAAPAGAAPAGATSAGATATSAPPATAAAAPATQGQAQQATSTGPQVAAAQAKVAEAQQTAAASQADAAAKDAAAKQAQATVATKEAAVAADRQSIAADQNAAIADQVAKAKAAGATGILLLEIVDTGYPFARVDFVDTKTGALIAASTINSIRSRSLVDGGPVFVAVAGKEGGTGAVRLVAIDKQSLAQTAQGEVDIFPESVVTKIGDAYFAVIKASDGKYYLGRFGADLKEGARSKDPVNPYTFVVQGPAGAATGASAGTSAAGAAATATVVAQAAAGGFLTLDATSLVTTGKLGL